MKLQKFKQFEADSNYYLTDAEKELFDDYYESEYEYLTKDEGGIANGFSTNNIYPDDDMFHILQHMSMQELKGKLKKFGLKISEGDNSTDGKEEINFNVVLI